MAQQEMDKLPKGWAENPLGEVVIVERGSSPRPIKNFITDDEDGVNWIKIGDATKGQMYIDSTKQRITPEGAKKSRYVGIGDFILSNSMSFGLPYIMAIPGYIHDGWFVIRLPEEINANYFYYLLSSSYLKNQFQLLAAGGVVLNISGDLVKKAVLPIAPLPEQKRIVEKLDSLLAQVDTIQQRLNNLPNIIKRFRQSVLAAAVSGKLTEQWRGNSEYRESNFGFEIPDTWSLCEIQNIGEVKGGKRLPKGEELVPEDTGYRYVRAGQLKNGTVINGDMARNSQMYLKANVQEQIKRYIVKKGDAYITIVGASIGDAGVVPEHYDGANLTENAAKICNFSKPMNSNFIGYWLRSQLIQQLIKLEIKSGAQGKLALKRIKTLPVPDISIEEQIEIVRLVEQHFALADTLEKNLTNAKKRVDNLTQSILAKAFRGELVPQDPNDEPADKLLERIKAARIEAEKLEKAAKKVAKANAKK